MQVRKKQVRVNRANIIALTQYYSTVTSVTVLLATLTPTASRLVLLYTLVILLSSHVCLGVL